MSANTPLPEDTTEDTRVAKNVSQFVPYAPKSKSKSIDFETWKLEASTRHGKPIADTEATDLYTKNTAPSFAILSKFNSSSFTDGDGRRYWDAKIVQSRVSWPRLDDLRTSSFFNTSQDRIFFVRPPPGTKPCDFTLPSVDLLRPHTFYKKQSGDVVSQFKAFVVDTGVDELDASSSASHSSLRKTTYVVIRGVP